MFNKVLIANRGEIAVRIASTLQQMGVTSVAVYSDADRSAPHVLSADEAYPLEGNSAAESYLRGEKIIEIARRYGVDAIHPGYGFLSENASFAQACRDAGIIFIGPSPEGIRALGDKVQAKKAMADAGVPVVPGWSGGDSDGPDRLAKEAKKIGYPVLLKAAAGGGGKGMRVVAAEKELPAALETCRREAAAAFGNSRVFVEKYIAHPRHVEFQIFGDSQGNVVHLFERECSIQRRHQKIVEETPSPALTPQLRGRMGDAAVKAAKAIGYANAGTVEFLVDEAGQFYFLEVNTRLQVEHPVTEMTLGLDLVALQLRIAAGEPLPFSQEALRPQGHAIECRIYAEDSARGFLPSTGVIRAYHPPCGPFIRVDSGVAESTEVSVYYDAMLAKLIVWGRTRDEALRRMSWALRRFVVLGVTTNIEFLQKIITHQEFAAGRTQTDFLVVHDIKAASDGPIPNEVYMAAAAASECQNGRKQKGTGDGRANSVYDDPWQRASAWRGV